MLFSTKAEYGVRLMIELGRQPGSTPISLNSVAEAERLPLSYLEHLVAKLRKAGLVTSTRGAHGGYRLADRACSTKLLWTRVQNGVTKALAGTTLAELVEFSAPHPRAESHGRGKPAV